MPAYKIWTWKEITTDEEDEGAGGTITSNQLLIDEDRDTVKKQIQEFKSQHAPQERNLPNLLDHLENNGLEAQEIITLQRLDAT